jgi:putative spermidine/putrescine transport system permease protein
VLTWLLAAGILAPVVVIVAGSFLDTRFLGISSEQWVGGGGGVVSFRWFAYVLKLYAPMLVFSFEIALLSVAICIAVGVPGGYALARRFPGSAILEELVLLPLSVPGITISIALIQAYAVFRGRWWIVLCGHLAYTIPFMIRSVTAALRASGLPSLEAAARTLGAGTFRRFRLVIVPTVRHATLLGSLLVFSISWGEFNVSFLLNTPLHQTYPAGLYAAFTFNSFQVSSAAATLFLAVVLPVLLAIQWIGGAERIEAGQGA